MCNSNFFKACFTQLSLIYLFSNSVQEVFNANALFPVDRCEQDCTVVAPSQPRVVRGEWVARGYRYKQLMVPRCQIVASSGVAATDHQTPVIQTTLYYSKQLMVPGCQIVASSGVAITDHQTLQTTIYYSKFSFCSGEAVTYIQPPVTVYIDYYKHNYIIQQQLYSSS